MLRIEPFTMHETTGKRLFKLSRKH
jgi:hypothetical protein